MGARQLKYGGWKLGVMFLPGMTTILLLQLALGSVVLFAGSIRDIAQTKDPKPSPTPAEKREKEEPEDRIYSAKEVDIKARVRRDLDDPPKPGTDCRRMRISVTVRAVLHKSGKVTEAELVKESGCSSYDKDALRTVRNVKFSPALKGNRPVSQYLMFEYQYSRF